jgi:ribosomal protein L17
MPNILAFFGRGKSSVSKRKQQILSEAEKDLDKLASMKTERTKAVEAQTGVESDITKAMRKRAKEARSLLTGSV